MTDLIDLLLESRRDALRILSKAAKDCDTPVFLFLHSARRHVIAGSERMIMEGLNPREWENLTNRRR